MPEKKEIEPIKVNILGSEWTIVYKDEDPAFVEAEGYCEDATRKIIIENIKIDKSDPLAFDLEAQAINQKRILRHEIMHAFLSESGLADSSTKVESWATNEEMVDWFARQSPKIFKVYKDLKLI